jgi:hypothetical protein
LRQVTAIESDEASVARAEREAVSSRTNPEISTGIFEEGSDDVSREAICSGEGLDNSVMHQREAVESGYPEVVSRGRLKHRADELAPQSIATGKGSKNTIAKTRQASTRAYPESVAVIE